MRKALFPLLFLLASCDKEPAIAPNPESWNRPTPTPSVQPVEKTRAVIALPAKPLITPEAHELIVDFETSGRRGYNPHPEWPRGQSGVTVGIGYDLGYSEKGIILQDWWKLSERARIANLAGLKGEKAHQRLSQVMDIMVAWNLANDVFDTVDIARWYAASQKALPGFNNLRPNAQGALVSLGFNRGWSMVGESRREMRAIRDLVPLQDYAGIATQLRKMSRIWLGTSNFNGLKRRRYAEAQLVELP